MNKTDVIDMFKGLNDLDLYNTPNLIVTRMILKSLDGKKMCKSDAEFMVANIVVDVNQRALDALGDDIDVCVDCFCNVIVKAFDIVKETFPLYYKDYISNRNQLKFELEL